MPSDNVKSRPTECGPVGMIGMGASTRRLFVFVAHAITLGLLRRIQRLRMRRRIASILARCVASNDATGRIRRSADTARINSHCT
jgi:hypothetical protein